MTQCADMSDEGALIREMQTRVDHLANLRLPQHDGSVACALVSLIAQFHRLSELHPAPTRTATLPRTMSWGTSRTESALPSTSDPLSRLQRQLTDLQLERDARSSEDGHSSRPPVQAVETALLWSRVDQDFDRILALCSQQASLVPEEEDAASLYDHLPPEYEAGEYRDPFMSDAELPLYEAGEYEGYVEKGEKARDSTAVAAGGMSDKMRMDLEAVALAIDRLYAVAPQLHDQRVELKKSKKEQMERARLAGPSREQERDEVRTKVRPGKEREREDVELERMVALIGKASKRKLLDQSVILDSGMQAKLEQARQRDSEKVCTLLRVRSLAVLIMLEARSICRTFGTTF